MTIFDLLMPKNIVSYWTELNVNKQPYVGETLFPNEKQLGTRLDWIKGASNQAVALRPSSYDAKAIRRDREGIEEASTKMPFFKESMYIDEETRQRLNDVIAANNQSKIDVILSRIYKDNAQLIEAAQISLERMRMEVLTTGALVLSANGQSFKYDYGMPEANKKTAAVSWSDPKADIVGEIEDIKEEANAKGIILTRAIINSSVAKDIRNNEALAKRIYVLSDGEVKPTREEAIRMLEDLTGITFLVYDNVYVDENKVAHKYVSDNTVAFLPDGDLGRTGLGTTPEESDLQNGLSANVSMVGEGIAVTTIQIADPVQTEVKVSMVALPSFERANEVYILDTEK